MEQANKKSIEIRFLSFPYYFFFTWNRVLFSFIVRVFFVRSFIHSLIFLEDPGQKKITSLERVSGTGAVGGARGGVASFPVGADVAVATSCCPEASSLGNPTPATPSLRSSPPPFNRVLLLFFFFSFSFFLPSFSFLFTLLASCCPPFPFDFTGFYRVLLGFT